MQERPPRRIVLTHWNAGVFQASALPQVLPELVIYALLYDDVLIREEDLLTNGHITGLLSEPENFRVFEELLAAGLVKLLRLPTAAYPANRVFDPVGMPITARAEEHKLRRTYKGRPWKPNTSEWRLFQQLDQIVVDHSSASRFHAPFPPNNLFAAEMAELLENRHQYCHTHPLFRNIHTKTADAFIRFCREPEAWQRFLQDAGVKSIIAGPDGGFYRSAAYQCFRLLPGPRSMRRLVESVYAATYCDRDSSDGRYSGSLIELPFRYELGEERDAAAETITKVEIVPTDAAAAIASGPGIATVLTRTRESPAFEELQHTLDQLGSGPSESSLLTEAAFRDAWRNLAAVYTEHWTTHCVPRATSDEGIPRFAVFAYILARVIGFIVLPHGPGYLEGPVVADAAAIAAIEKFGPSLLRGFRASLKTPSLHRNLSSSTTVRCSTVSLNTKPK